MRDRSWAIPGADVAGRALAGLLLLSRRGAGAWTGSRFYAAVAQRRAHALCPRIELIQTDSARRGAWIQTVGFAQSAARRLGMSGFAAPAASMSCRPSVCQHGANGSRVSRELKRAARVSGGCVAQFSNTRGQASLESPSLQLLLLSYSPVAPAPRVSIRFALRPRSRLSIPATGTGSADLIMTVRAIFSVRLTTGMPSHHLTNPADQIAVAAT